jgi:hypothetical protein
MPSSILNSDDGVISGTSGLKSSGGDDGVLNIQNNGTTAVTVDASGKFVVGDTTARTSGAPGDPTPPIQVVGSTYATSGAGLFHYQNGVANSSFLSFNKSRGTSLGTQTILNNGDRYGGIVFCGSDGTAFIPSAQIDAQVDGTPGTNDMPGRLRFFTTADGASSPTERMRLDSSGNLLFNSGYGSVATAYGCRAWVNFDGTGTVAIREDGNVSSITDGGTGDYTINFTTAMPDANYAWSLAASDSASGFGIVTMRSVTAPTTSALRIKTTDNSNNFADNSYICAAIFR